jgi:hypothetical protein
MSISIVLSEKVNNSLLRIAEECVLKAVEFCASKYNFSAEEALRELGVMSIEVVKGGKKSGKKVEKVQTVKASFPLPYNGEMNAECCSALRQNNGLYTQCTGGRRGESPYCKGCASQMQKTGAEVPEYGTIEMRKAVGIFEYVDPKGRKPVAYTKVMKKYKLTEEQVLEEANKMNMEINREHFAEEEVKRGRPKTVEKEPKEKGTRGRPKKSKKVMEIDGDTEDLFATLVANANEEVEEEVVKSDVVKPDVVKPDVVKSEDLKKEKAEQAKKEKEAKLAAKEAAKKEKELAAEQAKKEKEAKLAAKEAAKKEKEEEAKKEKEAKLAAKEAAKTSKKSEKKTPEQAGEKEDDEEPDVVKKIEFEGKKYLKSKKTGIIYDYTEYAKNGEQVVVGKWNDASNKIDFTDEEDEEEYEM